MLAPSQSPVQYLIIVIRKVGPALESSCSVWATFCPMRYPVVITEDLEDGGYNASCPALPGCHSEGDTIEEAMEGIREAIACYLESMALDGLPAPGAAPVITKVEIA